MSRVGHSRELRYLLGLLLLQCLGLCAAQQPASVVDEPKNGPYHGRMTSVTAHTTWLERDGAPANITAITETTDGFLWLGTPSGLFRFDGAQFTSYPSTSLDAPLPSNFITALISDEHGGLWIGYHSTGISHLLASGVVVNYSPGAGSAPKSAQRFAYGADGTLWAIADYHLYRLRADQWENFGSTHGLPNDPLFALYVDHAGALWTSARGRLFSMKREGTMFAPYPTKTFIVVDMVEMPNGEIWICDAWRRIRPLASSSKNKGWSINGYVRLAVEANGTLWLAQDYRGVNHVKWPAISSALIKEPGLSSEQTGALYKDSEDNIWVGTSRGLDRFHSTQIKRVSNTRIEYYPSLCAAPKGGVWISTLARPLVFAKDDVLKPFGKDLGSAPIACREDGSVWMVDPITSKLVGWSQGRIIRIAIPPSIRLAGGTSIGFDHDGSLLIGFHTYGLWRFDGAWTQVVDSALPDEEPLSMYRDSKSRLWLGYTGGVIGLRDRFGSKTLSPARADNLGNVLSFAEVDNQILAAGTNGVAVVEAGAIRKAPWIPVGVIRGVSGMVQDHSGDLWLNTVAGLYRVRHRNMHAGMKGVAEYDRFDDRQGVQGSAAQEAPLPSLVLDKHGSIWAATSGSALEINPVNIASHHRPPLLVIEKVLYNGDLIADREHRLSLISFNVRKLKELEIDYAGVDLSAPDSIRYRVMMEGKDTEWQEIGDRRQAFYDHLAPGKYRFRVAESNDVGQWFELQTPLSIDVQPAYYETAWFRVAVVLLFAALLYLAYFLRMQVVTNALRGKLQERANERLRIARELHDTLLQSLHGLMLRFHFATNELPEDEPARHPLELALQRADTAFLEARQRIESLREELPDELQLQQQLLDMAEDLRAGSHLDFAVRQEGDTRPLRKQVQLELCRIAQEALVNTLNHARATTARIDVIYTPSELRMCCTDDGVGLPPEIREKGRRAGHWGLVGIAERTAVLNGTLSLNATHGGGTKIEVRIAARRAYRDGVGWLGGSYLAELRKYLRCFGKRR